MKEIDVALEVLIERGISLLEKIGQQEEGYFEWADNAESIFLIPPFKIKGVPKKHWVDTYAFLVIDPEDGVLSHLFAQKKEKYKTTSYETSIRVPNKKGVRPYVLVENYKKYTRSIQKVFNKTRKL